MLLKRGLNAADAAAKAVAFQRTFLTSMLNLGLRTALSQCK
jgi:hypothetical protein